MTIHQLMVDEKARDHYLAIPATRAPWDLASDYMLAKLADDRSAMLAIECHVRDLARAHFESASVRDCLATVERVKSTRKFGTGAPKSLQKIADSIARRYSFGHFERLADGRIKFKIPVDGSGYLFLTCQDTPGAVAWMAAKYRRGMPKSRAGRYGTNNV